MTYSLFKIIKGKKTKYIQKYALTHVLTEQLALTVSISLRIIYTTSTMYRLFVAGQEFDLSTLRTQILVLYI